MRLMSREDCRQSVPSYEEHNFLHFVSRHKQQQINKILQTSAAEQDNMFFFSARLLQFTVPLSESDIDDTEGRCLFQSLISFCSPRLAIFALKSVMMQFLVDCSILHLISSLHDQEGRKTQHKMFLFLAFTANSIFFPLL